MFDHFNSSLGCTELRKTLQPHQNPTELDSLQRHEHSKKTEEMDGKKPSAKHLFHFTRVQSISSRLFHEQTWNEYNDHLKHFVSQKSKLSKSQMLGKH